MPKIIVIGHLFLKLLYKCIHMFFIGTQCMYMFPLGHGALWHFI